jgi:hypothetical protein
VEEATWGLSVVDWDAIVAIREMAGIIHTTSMGFSSLKV